jgi:fucose permease
MKDLNISSACKNIAALLTLTLISTITWAQDSTATSATSSSSKVTTETTSYVEPWVWVVGAAVVIIIIILLTRGSGKSRAAGTTDKVTYTKQVSREDDV